ncbi:MAG: thiamine pyrophosphate-dependent dehydrogenase E1 component subunit alpha, partial [Candidatus Omnitrophica bacterium]|nr:thiamine pyrophosphate-dependent dehydrogenase E1 component subunit alpha [Candidatus Omnitrophota bacterium]
KMKLSKEKLLEIYRSISKIRKVELKIEELYHLDEMKTPVHLCLGQEAVSASVCSNLKKDDMIFSNHRSHGHYLAKGGDMNSLIAEFYCKETGCAKGRGGSMHVIDTSVGHYGSSAIVGGSIPHAVGAALAFKMQKKDLVAVSFFGDAASEEGVFYESMNLAQLKKLPVVFVCENNRYSVCSHVSVRQPNEDISMRAKAFDIPAKQVDGMNAIEVYEGANIAIEHARSGKGPYLLECKVQRWRGHAGAGDPMKDQYRVPEDLDDSAVRDPLDEYKTYLLAGKVSREELQIIDQDIDEQVAAAFKYGQESPLPDRADLEKYLFAE